MTGVPGRPKIYHITHVENLPAILEAGRLWSDAKRIELGLTCEIVGMSSIKKRRLERLEVKCHRGTVVGDYVPFYFCPRSIMLYILHKGNHQEITYTGGQDPMIHLVSHLDDTIEWADSNSRYWAFTDRNAGASYAEFFNDISELCHINWHAVQEDDFRDPLIKEGKQAEFLIYESFPWSLIEQIGVIDQSTRQRVTGIIRGASHRPEVTVERSWYF